MVKKITDKTDWGMTLRTYIFNLLIQGKEKKAERLAKKYDLMWAYYEGMAQIGKLKLKFSKKQIDRAKRDENKFYKPSLGFK